MSRAQAVALPCRVCERTEVAIDAPKNGWLRIKCAQCGASKTRRTRHHGFMVAEWNTKYSDYDAHCIDARYLVA